MIENYLLEELVVFAQTGTLAKTAATLNVTQPTVTRGMQKLEADWEVQLFDRQPNRLSLTPAGELAAKEAATLLAENHQAVERIRNFERSQRVLTIATTIPGPLVALRHIYAQLPKSVHLPNISQPETQVITGLKNNNYLLGFSNHSLTTETIDSQLIGTEHLAINLNQFMFQANQSTITFAELKDLSFVVPSDIGPWRKIIQANIPNAKFFYQEERAALTEITKYADFPYFSTNISIFDAVIPQQAAANDSRVCLPISDAAAQMSIYAIYLRSQRARVQPVISQLTAMWPN
ncbi:LysR family transcriptional regulator [Levilactobacillus fujinensis]|uniref:LysR family transcriptional regulator n=1 Tax=Levilactobacillus fujinensis TaxID=2486024 RepID=A0ABW1TJY4_9LACO|nr:LysR family transcriptional regulator [Levilactobacillus fujinensis]